MLTNGHKEIKTGYFGQLKRYIEAGYTPVCIARGKPRWFHGEQLQELAPSRPLLHAWGNRITDKNVWRRKFLQELEAVDPKRILRELPDKAVLLCYEKAEEHDDWCHRHMVAEWFHHKTGIQIDELRL